MTSSNQGRNEIIRIHTAGNLGRKVQLVTNNFQLSFKDPCKEICQYDLSIVDPKRAKSAVPSKSVCWEVFAELNLGDGWAYDGHKNLYHYQSTTVNTETKVKVGRVTYDVTIRGPVAKVSAKQILDAVKKAGSVVPSDAVTALNMVLCMGFQTSQYVTVRKAVFKSGQTGHSLPGGLLLYDGTSTSVTPTQEFGITIRVLKTNQVMYPGGKLIEFIKGNMGSAPGGFSRGDRNTRAPLSITKDKVHYFNKILKNLKMSTLHLGYPRKYTIAGMHTGNAEETTIADLGGKSVKEYFKSQYNIALEFPKLPLVKCGGGKTLLPIELCTLLPDQPYYTSLTDVQQREMIKIACQKPEDKMRDINTAATEVAKSTHSFTSMGYGFQVNPRAIEISGRVLDPPDMGPNTEVRRGSWNIRAVIESVDPQTLGLRYFRFVSLAPKHKYDKQMHERFVGLLEQKALEMSLPVRKDDLTSATLTYVRMRDFEEELKTHDKKFKYTIVILGNDKEYGHVKLVEQNSKMTQCIKLNTVMKICGISKNRPARPDHKTAQNFLLKTNSKLGGTNFWVKVQGLPTNIFSKPVMIVGADVTHFTRSEEKPSIAAVVATCDPKAGQYISRTKAMYPRVGSLSVEYIQGMDSIMTGILKEFRHKNGVGPSRIIYYRDGVSEGQFENTVMEELCGIQDACTGLSPNYKPRISVVVCTKRHKQRFVVKGDHGKHTNMSPGTVVDTGVVAPNYLNFYLCSQEAIQGTSVPCHYYVLYDDNKLPINMWQTLSFYLCHTYARCSRSVSYPAPIYYAHLACASARERMLAYKDWGSLLQTRPSEEELNKIIRPANFNHYFI